MAPPSSLTQAHVRRLLLLGLGLSVLLLLTALLIAMRTVHHFDQNTQTFAEGESAAKAAIDGIERQQGELNARWLKLANKKDLVRREEILDELAQSRSRMSNALESAYAQAELLRESIYQEGHGLLRLTVWVFAACVGLSLGCAIWTVRASSTLFRQLEQQAGALTQLQYQFMETQEDTARRFSHELHDELGQALTAVKANLSALRSNGEQSRRVDDCLQLVDTAIKDVREMSQLLRPTILDDFGLDAALHSLTDSFAQRTGIQVTYRGELAGRRLRDQTETHLFRIAQEALTNVARHSQATTVDVALQARNGQVLLGIHDNGRGFVQQQPRIAAGLGLAGMKTRAEGCNGQLTIDTAAGKGTNIQVSCPAG